MNIVQRMTRNPESCRALTNNERRAEWSAKFYAAGHHLRQQKPRIRVTVSRTKG